MSVLLGEIERVRASHDAQRHLDLDREEDEEECLPEDGVDDGGEPPRDGGNGGRGFKHPSAFLLEFQAGSRCTKRGVTPEEFGAALGKKENGMRSESTGRLLLLYGLPEEYVRVMVKVSGGVRPGFIEAHAERRCYRPLGVPREFADSYEHWEYPELVQGFDPSVTRLKKMDMMEPPKIFSLGRGDMAAVFCRASLWRGFGTSILFLDRPFWMDVPGLRKARRSVCARTSGQSGMAAGEEKGDMTPSLEHAILSSRLGPGERLLLPQSLLLEERAFDHWLDLFGVLSPPTHQRRGTSLAGCLSQILHSLELNEDASSYRVRRREMDKMLFSPAMDWSTLLARVQRRATLLSASPTLRTPVLTPSSTLITNTSTRTPGGTRKVKIAGTAGTGSFPPGRTPGRSGRELLDENHRALDRISYLGGILLPLPIVSSILSMNDIYSPEGDKFYIFWAASLPLSVLAVLIIYADTIRRAEVWVEVASEHVGALSSSSRAEGVGGAEKSWIASHWQMIARKSGGNQDEESQVPPEKVDSGIPLKAEPRILEPPIAIPGPARDKLDEQLSDQDDVEEEVPAQLPVLYSLGPGLYAAEEDDHPNLIMEPLLDGQKPRAWQRRQLGWGGAVRSIVSQRKPRYCHEHSPEDLVAHEAHLRREKPDREKRVGEL